MWNIKWFYNNFSTGTKDSHRAFPFGNIDAYCVHIHKNLYSAAKPAAQIVMKIFLIFHHTDKIPLKEATIQSTGR